MEASETKILELTQAICRLHRYNNAIEMLAHEGFDNVSVEFVQAIQDQLEKEADKFVKIHREKAENTLYYTFDKHGKKSLALLSERYFLLRSHESIDPNIHELELFDLFNDKSM
jgi:hypothetical protein